MEEAGTVPFVKGQRSTHELTKVTQRRKELSSGQRRANILFGKWFARRAESVSRFLKASSRERDVRRDDDVIDPQVLDYPVVSRIHALPNDSQGEPIPFRDSHPRPSHQSDAQVVSLCHAIDFLFHRTGVGVYKDMEQ